MDRYAVLIDLTQLRLGAGMLRRLFDDIEEANSIEYIKFYGYNTKRHRELRSLVSEYHIDVDLPMTGRVRSRIDIREAMDAVRIASTCPTINRFFIVSAEVDGIYLVSELKRMGKLVTIGVTSPTTLSDNAHDIYLFDRMDEIESEVAAASICDDKEVKTDEKQKDTKVVTQDTKGIFPFSDIDSKDISDKMAKIDEKIMDMIELRRSNRSSNIYKIFDSIDK